MAKSSTKREHTAKDLLYLPMIDKRPIRHRENRHNHGPQNRKAPESLHQSTPTIMPKQIHKINRRSHGKQVLKAQQNRKEKPTSQILSLLQKRKRDQQNPQQKPIVLEMQMVHNHKHWGPNNQYPDQNSLP